MRAEEDRSSREVGEGRKPEGDEEVRTLRNEIPDYPSNAMTAAGLE